MLLIGGNRHAAPTSARGTGRAAYTKDVRSLQAGETHGTLVIATIASEPYAQVRTATKELGTAPSATLAIFCAHHWHNEHVRSSSHMFVSTGILPKSSQVRTRSKAAEAHASVSGA